MFRDLRGEVVTVETVHSVPTRFLRNVKRAVRRTNQCVAAGDARMGPTSDTKARRALDRAAVERECTRLHFLAHPLGERHGRIEHGTWQEQHELLAAIAADTIDLLACFVFQNARALLADRVPGLVAVRAGHGV